MTKNDSAFRIPYSAFFVLLVVFTYFFGLSLPFFGPDEPRYAQVAREMFESGDWITPTLGGFEWFEKPALLYWLQIVSYNIFGVNEFAARFGPALFGLGTVVSLWIFGKLEPPAVTGGLTQPFATWLAIIAASTLGIIVFARGASFDIIVTFPLTAAMVSYYLFERRVKPPATAGGSDSTLPLVSFYFFIGMAVLAKGLIGFVFPFAIVGFYHVLARKLPSARFAASLLWGMPLAVAVASTWYLPMYLKHGWPFIDEFFVQHHFQRFTSNKYQHPQPFFFYLWVLPLMVLPWLPFFVAGLVNAVKSILVKGRNVPLFPSSPLLLFSLAWLAVPLVFFSLSGSKLPGYILPAVPPAIVIAAWYAYSLAAKSKIWGRVLVAIACATLIVCVILLASVVPRFADADSLHGLIKSASERGYTSEPVFGLHTISHSAEFYAAGRLLRDPEGRQKKLYSGAEIEAEMRRLNVRRALILVPPEYLKQLTDSTIVNSDVIRDNGEWVIVGVSLDRP